jgi:hypothetical protein
MPSLQQLRSQWDQIRLRAYEHHMPLKTPLSRATIDAFEGGLVTIGLVDDVQESLVRAKMVVLEAAFADVVGAPVRVALHSVAPAGSGRRASNAHGAHRAPPRDREALPSDGEHDLMAYAQQRLGTQREAEK